jgi:F0F1-type ATP synthase delta subunit
MHAASREALAAAELRLLDVIDGADDQGLVTLGEELFAVVRLLIGEHALRRAVSDPASEPQAREGLVRNLLASKVGDGALKVLTAAVTARWSSARELLDGLESLARTALLVRAERGNRLDAVEDELFRLGRIIAGQAELAQVLGSSGGNAAGKAARPRHRRRPRGAHRGRRPAPRALRRLRAVGRRADRGAGGPAGLDSRADLRPSGRAARRDRPGGARWTGGQGRRRGHRRQRGGPAGPAATQSGRLSRLPNVDLPRAK